jgi:hypothetical protein
MNYDLTPSQIETLVPLIFRWRQRLYQKSFFYFGFFAFFLVILMFNEGLYAKALLNSGFAALTILLGLFFQIGRKKQIRSALGKPGKREVSFTEEKITYTEADCPSGFWWNNKDIVSAGVSKDFFILIADDTAHPPDFELFTHIVAIPLNEEGNKASLDELKKLCESNDVEVQQIRK